MPNTLTDHQVDLVLIANLEEPMDPSYTAGTPFSANSPEHVVCVKKA